MTFLRRGNVSFPHRMHASITLQAYGGEIFRVFLKNVSCFEEHRTNEGETIVAVFFTSGSNKVVRQTFDEIDAAFRKWEVAHAD